MNNRRAFLQTAGSALAGVALRPALRAATTAPTAPLDLSIFTKHFIGLPFEQIAEIVATLGASGIEAPIRPGGHIEPAKVEDELPKFVEVLKKHGLRINVLTSGINSVSEATRTESILRTAKALGIPRFRMNYYLYDNKKPIWPQLDEIKPRLKELVALCKEIGIQPCYQNHSGAKMAGAAIWDMALLMRDYKPEELSWCFDIMHATIEGGTSWPTEVRLVRDHIATAYFKNFVWEGTRHKAVPLGEGVVGKPYIDQLKSLDYRGPVSVHVEYLKGSVKDPDYLARAIEATRTDIATLRNWWE
jgi:sugar phosphate isomerase/epimerase